MRIERSSRCEEDLIQIWIGIALDGPRAADRMIDRIEQSWRRLEMFPESAAKRPGLPDDIRMIVAGTYLSFYRVEADCVRILRVMNGKRDISAADLA